MIKNIKPQNIELNKDVPQDLLTQIDVDEFNELNEEDQWCIKGESSSNFTSNIVFKISSKINIQTLVFKDKRNHQFLYNILSPQFEKLTFLKLCDNFLTSIEPFSFIYAPNLQYINVSGNRIQSLKPLVKLPSLQLNEISIDKNYFIDPQNFFIHLSRYPIGGKNQICQMIKLQTKSMPREGYPQLQCQDLRFIAKLQCSFLMDLKFLHSTRIQQQSVRQCRRRKNLMMIPHNAPLYQ